MTPRRRFFAALKHRQAVDSTRDRLTLTENIRQLFDELIRGEASGVSQLQLDCLDHLSSALTANLDIEMSSYRSAC